ncbi:MAG: DegV family protein [Dehalogenimonas sp.]|uniref:DegV family protein n=1 Tax=Candidatus Dehalogenimonas loeffleri TaxID=3127115 RepID=A0ABZ2J8B8_9CHLR|nr:DegV family protein [Dehalogenimonas sp.]
MAVRVVTDSTADLPPAILSELGIIAVPLYVLFGEQVYKDGIGITQDEFYARLPVDPIHPNTSQPSPQDFLEVYEKLAAEGDDQIISIHISKKLSGTCDSAMQAKQMLEGKASVEVVDSVSVSMGLGLLALMAGCMAKEGRSLAEIKAAVEKAVPEIHVLALFDTLKYLAAGGRIGKAKALVGSMLNVKPVLIVKDGEMQPAGQVRSRVKGIERLVEWAGSFKDIADMSVGHTTTPEEMDKLAGLLAGTFTQDQIIKARLGAVLGTHAGPGTLFVALRTAG